MRILESEPDKFYLVLRDNIKTFESLSQLEFKGLKGISDNPNIINSFFDIRPILLVMDGKEVLKLNKNLQKIDYENPHQLVSNNFEILSRLLGNDELLLRNIFNVMKVKIGDLFFNNWKLRDKNKELVSTVNFFEEHEYEVSNIIKKEVKKGLIINNLWGFTNVVLNSYKQLKKENNIKTSKQSYKKINYNELYHMIINNPRYTYYVLQEILLAIGSSWKDKEGEWVIKKDKIDKELYFKIPQNSTLYFKTSLNPDNASELEEIKNYQKNYKSWNDGYSNDTDISILHDNIKTYNLANLYNIEYIKGHYRAYDMFKKYNYPKTKQYTGLMKNPLDKRLKKNFYKK